MAECKELPTKKDQGNMKSLTSYQLHFRPADVSTIKFKSQKD